MPWLKTEEGAEQTGLQEGGNNFVIIKEALLCATVKAPQENTTEESGKWKRRGLYES